MSAMNTAVKFLTHVLPPAGSGQACRWGVYNTHTKCLLSAKKRLLCTLARMVPFDHRFIPSKPLVLVCGAAAASDRGDDL